jgi:hypothetical protein
MSSPTVNVQVTAQLLTGTPPNQTPVPTTETLDFQYKLHTDTAWTLAGSAPTDASSNATVTIALQAPDAYDIEALFNGDVVYHASTAQQTFDTTQSQITSNLQIAVAESGQIVGILTAGGVGLSSEVITLDDDGTALPSQTTLPDGTFSYQEPNPAVGTHNITAKFAGNANYTPAQATGTFVVAGPSMGYVPFITPTLQAIDAANMAVYSLAKTLPGIGQIVPPPPRLAGITGS